jgi:hypothetical protein
MRGRERNKETENEREKETGRERKEGRNSLYFHTFPEK